MLFNNGYSFYNLPIVAKIEGNICPDPSKYKFEDRQNDMRQNETITADSLLEYVLRIYPQIKEGYLQFPERLRNL